MSAGEGQIYHRGHGEHRGFEGLLTFNWILIKEMMVED
jgi:hypothetical protein